MCFSSFFFSFAAFYSRSRSYYSYSQLLGDVYEQQLGLNHHEVQWLNKFYPPPHPFLRAEVAREGSVRLFVAVINQLEAHCKAAGSTLPKRVRELEDATEEYDHRYDRLTNTYTNRNMAGHKVGAAIFQTIFFHCELAVRRHYGFQEFDANVYFAEHNDPERQFNQYFGDLLPGLLGPLVQTLPSPDEALEQAFNLADPKRWQPRFEQLLALLPAQPARFEEAVYALARQNERNPKIATIFQQAAWQLGAAGGPATLRLYLHYLAYGRLQYPFKPKTLLKRVQKVLFPRPEQLPRFEAIAQELLRNRNLPAALAALPGVFQQERRKIELSHDAVRAVRQQHSGTVELLNEYLRDEPAVPLPVASTVPDAPAATPVAPAPAALAAAASPPVAVAPAVALSAPRQALLALFAAHGFALPRAEVEALAARHGTLRHQLIDGLNETCYELLDDVLVEETEGGYAIYAPYYQKIAPLA